MDERGVSPLVGFVLLIGLVAIASAGIMLSASGIMTETEQQIEQDRIEQAMVELNDEMHSAAQDPDTWREVDIDAEDSGAVVRAETGEITIESEALEEDIDTTIGTVEWEGEDGTKIASEAGAVFRETGNETRVVSKPQFEYDYSTSTFNLDVVTISGEHDLGSGDIRIGQEDVTAHAGTGVIEDEDVMITVDSEYCVGWETYFIKEAGEGSIQEYCGENGIVTAQIGYLDVAESFEEDINYHTGGEINDHHGKFDNPTPGHHEPLDDLIEGLVEDAESGESEMEIEDFDDSSEPIETGTYFVDGNLNLDDTTEYNLENGDITLIVKGDIVGEGNIHVKNSDDNALRIFTDGEEFNIGGEICTLDEGDCSEDGENAEHIQIYGTSDLAVKFGPGKNQGAHFEGLIYAAAEEDKGWDTGSGNGNGNSCGGEQFAYQAGGESFYGSLVVYSACAHSNSVDEIEYESSPDDIDAFPDGISMPPSLTYLNVAEHEIGIESN